MLNQSTRPSVNKPEAADRSAWTATLDASPYIVGILLALLLSWLGIL